MLDSAIASRARHFVLSLLTLLVPACAAPESTESEDTAAAELRAYFEGTAPVPGPSVRARHRAELARLATRSSGARRAGLELDIEDGWWPIGERAAGALRPADTSAWQLDGDIDATGMFVPVRGACPPRTPLDTGALPEDVRRPPREERPAEPRRSDPAQEEVSRAPDGRSRAAADSPEMDGLDLAERADRLACALDRLVGRELRVTWEPGQSQAAVIDPKELVALVNPRLFALVEPDAPPRWDGPAPPVGAHSPHSDHPNRPAGSISAAPALEPLDRNSEGDNEHHPRPPSNDSGGSSRTFCDRVCDDVWNDAFKCDCDGSPGEGSSHGCDCGGSPGDSGGCGSDACKCGTASRGAQDRAGVLAGALVAGTLALRRRRRDAPRGQRTGGRRLPWLLLAMALFAWPARSFAAPPKLIDVHVTVTPAEAAVFVDGNAVVPERGVVRVPAGSHIFSAKLEGYADAAQTVEVKDGGTGTLVSLRLVADRGYVVITSRDPTVHLAIDGTGVGQGSFSGLVTPGSHVITATDSAGHPRSYVVTAVAGQSITMSVDGPPTHFPTPPAAGAPPEKKTEKKTEKPRPPPQSGPYAILNTGIFWTTGRPYGFEHGDTPAPGFTVGGRGGYRFNNVVGLEALLEYGRISNGGTQVQTYDIDQNGDGAVSGGEAATSRGPAGYALESLRLGPLLRLTTEGRENRFLGGIGIGALHEQISLDHPDLVWDAATSTYTQRGTFHHDYEGWSPYLLFEAGYERSIRAFLAAVVMQITVESVSGLGGDPYNSSVQARFGLCLRGGYAGW